jgi:hypothetical protein|tara:strand:+ start:1625 stop:2137 length:513 start_codon:yes stop_codon:yes gene_type:complete
MDKKRTGEETKVEMGKIIKFPMDKVIRRKREEGPKLSEEEAQAMKEETFIENLSEQMTLDIIEDLRDNAVAMDSDIFLQDLAVLVETLKAMLKRDFGHKHPMHDITDNLTKIITTPDGRKFTDINYAKISVSPKIKAEDFLDTIGKIQKEIQEDDPTRKDELEIEFIPEE